MNFFEEMRLKEIQFLFEDSFNSRGFKVSEFVLLEDNQCKFLVNKRDKITVDMTNKKWKLNGLWKGEIFGKSFTDVSGDYEFESAK